jgi:hypothetical protein
MTFTAHIANNSSVRHSGARYAHKAGEILVTVVKFPQHRCCKEFMIQPFGWAPNCTLGRIHIHALLERLLPNSPRRRRGGVQVWLYSLTSTLHGGGRSTPRPSHFTPGTYCIGGWVKTSKYSKILLEGLFN